jgi:hypothetical protein
LFGAARSDRSALNHPLRQSTVGHADRSQIDFGEFSGTATIAEINPATPLLSMKNLRRSHR